MTLPEAQTAGVLDRLFGALSAGDVDEAVACLTSDAVVWHGFDQVEQDVAAVTAGWRQMLVSFPRRSFVDVRRSAVPGGWVQRHQMIATTASGTRMAWPICLFATLASDGRIARLDEYIDRAGSYQPDGDAAATPGLEPAVPGSVL